MKIKMFWHKRKKKRITKTYLYGLMQKAVPLAQYWVMQIKDCEDPQRAKRIVRHLHRIRKVQLKAEATLYNKDA